MARNDGSHIGSDGSPVREQHGYHGRFPRVDLSAGEVTIDEPPPAFYRTYVGGGLMGTALLLRGPLARPGPKAGVRLDREASVESIATYYEMMGRDEDSVPRSGTLYDHHLEWALGYVHASRATGISERW